MRTSVQKTPATQLVAVDGILAAQVLHKLGATSVLAFNEEKR